MRLPLMFILAALLAACTPAGQQAAPAHKPTLAAAVNPLTVPAWWIDPSNSTGCASDTNTAIQATCGGPNIGPLKSWAGLALQYCGPYVNVASCCPRLLQTTQVTFLSSHVDATDPVYACANLESTSGPAFVLAGNLGPAQQVAVGTLGTITAKNRATNTPLGTLFTLTAPDGGAAPTLLAGELVVNTTHPSAAWINTVGSPNTMTQPLARYTVGTSAVGLAEVDTWTLGDAVTVFQPVNVDVVQVSGHTTEINTSTFANAVVLWNLNVFDPQVGASNFDSLQVFGDIGPIIVESSISRALTVQSTQSGLIGTQVINSSFASNAGAKGGIGNSISPVTFNAGQTGSLFLSSGNIDKDTIVQGAANNQIGSAGLGFVFIPSGKTLAVSGAPSQVSSTGVIYGTGTLNVSGNGRLAYPAGASKAAAAFIGVTLQENGQTLALISKPSSATGVVLGNVTLSAANLDSNFGATTGCAIGAGAQICNAP